jgi:hypothetical protein
MARDPYRIARQEHVGDALDALTRSGLLSWRWEYDHVRSRAIFHVTLPGEAERALDTRSAEVQVQGLYRAIGVRWLPVPHPGGERQLEETLRRMGDDPLAAERRASASVRIAAIR